MITAVVVYYTPGPYGPMQHVYGRTAFFTAEELRANVRNADSVLSRKGAGHIVMDRDSRLAFQVAGYWWNRGAYQDVLSREELAPYLTSENLEKGVLA